MNYHDIGRDKNIATNVAAIQDDRTAAAAAFKPGDRVRFRDWSQPGGARGSTIAKVVGVHDWFGIKCVDVDFGGTVRRVVAERVRRERR
jgi:hypothetical protein